MIPLQEQIQHDCTVLLERALVGKMVCAFGDDGCGQFGRSPIPAFFKIDTVRVYIADITDTASPVLGLAYIRLDGYNANVAGHILTDKNFQISIRKLLAAESISPDTLTWGTFSEQVPTCVVMQIDVRELFDC
jgi:hypothetical protein